MIVFFYGVSWIEDVTAHLMGHLSLYLTLRNCSVNTILRTIRKFTVENIPGKVTCIWLPSASYADLIFTAAPQKSLIFPFYIFLQRKCKGFAKDAKCILYFINNLRYVLHFCILIFHHRNAASLGIAQANLSLLSLLCILIFHHRNAASLGIAQVNLTLRSLLCILQNSIIK